MISLLQIATKYVGSKQYAAETNAIVAAINAINDEIGDPSLAIQSDNPNAPRYVRYYYSGEKLTHTVINLLETTINSIIALNTTSGIDPLTLPTETEHSTWTSTEFNTVVAKVNEVIPYANNPVVLTPLAAPTSNLLVAGNATATQTWDQVTGNNGYRAEISTDNFATIAQFATLGTGVTTKVWTGLTNNTLVYSRVRATGNLTTTSNSAFSNISSDTPAVVTTPKPMLASITIEDANKHQFIATFTTDNNANLDNTSVPNAYDFTVENSSGTVAVGELEAVNTNEAPATLRYPIDLTHTATFGNTGATPPYKTLINESHFARLQQDGNLIKATFELKSKPSTLNHWYVEVWRPAGGVMSLVGRSADVISQINSGLNTVTFSAIAVKEGDRIGVSYSTTVQENTVFLALESNQNNPGLAAGGMYWTNDRGFISADITGWGHEDSVFPILAILSASPFIITAGDSNFEGYDYYANLQNYNGENLSATLLYQINRLLNCTGQNKGISGDTAEQTAAFFDNGTLNRHPKWVVFDMTINGDNAITHSYGANFRAQYEAMFIKCQAAGIKMIMESFIPHAQYLDSDIDGPTAAMQTLCATYGVIFVDIRPALGVRVNGNSWQIQSQYAANANHINGAGNAVRAKLITDEIRKRTPVIVTGKTVKITLNKDLVYSSSPLLTYARNMPYILDSVGASANSFTSHAVINNIAPAPENLSFDPVYQFVNVGPNSWDGVRGMATVRVPDNTQGWAAMKLHVGVPSSLYFANQDDLNFYATDPNNPYAWVLCGFYYNGTTFFWVRGNQTFYNSGSAQEGYYYRLRRGISGGVATFYIEESATGTVGSTWTNIYTLPSHASLDGRTDAIYINAEKSVDTPVGFGVEAYSLGAQIAAPASVTATAVTGGLSVSFPLVTGADSYVVGASELNTVPAYFKEYPAAGSGSPIVINGLNNTKSYYVVVYAKKAGFFSSPLTIASTAVAPL